MKHTLFVFASLLLASFMVSSCSSSKRLGKGSKKELDSTYLLNQLNKHKIDADWFSSRIRVEYDDGNTNVSGTATLRMKKDSIVWLSVKKFGLELARVQVTSDSVYVLDRINNEYTVEGLEYLASSYGLPASLIGLQDFLLGNAVVFGKPEMEVEALGPTYKLSAVDDQFKSEYWIDASSFFVHKMAFDDKANEQQVNVLLEEFGSIGNQDNFSYLRTLDAKGKALGNTSIGLKFSKVEIDVPKDIKFDIPSKYTRAD